MKMIIGKSKWEMWDDPLEAFLSRAKGDGFKAVEIYLKSLKESPEEIARLHDQYGLRLVGQVLAYSSTYTGQLRELEEQFEFARQCQVAFVNSHLGRDIFPFEQNLEIFRRAVALSEESGIPILVETHRGRPTYSAIETRRYLEALPSLQITADFSHWMVVHESDLSDQVENLDLAIQRSRYIHARVGYSEGPQVPDPRAPEWKGAVYAHLKLWQRIADSHLARGEETFYISPEFGPPAYMHTLPFTNQPVADVWEINVYMKSLLEGSLQVE